MELRAQESELGAHAQAVIDRQAQQNENLRAQDAQMANSFEASLQQMRTAQAQRQEQFTLQPQSDQEPFRAQLEQQAHKGHSQIVQNLR